MKSFSENQSKIQSLVETLPNDRSLSSSVWGILREAPPEQQANLLEFYEKLVRANTKRTHKTKPCSSDQALFTPLRGDSFIRLRLHVNCSSDDFYRDACQWLMRQPSFAEQVQLLHFLVNDPRLPYFPFNSKLRQGMSDEHFDLLEEDLPQEILTEIRRLVHRSIPYRHWRYKQLLTILDKESDPDQRAAMLAFIADEHIRHKDFEKHLYRLSELERHLTGNMPDFSEEIPIEAIGEPPKKQ